MKALRGPIWLVLIIGWVIAILVALIDDQPTFAFALGIIAILNWVATGYFFGWLFGVRRHVRRHLNCRVNSVVELTFHPHGQERSDIIRAIEAIFDADSVANKRLGLTHTYGNLLDHLQNNNETAPLKFESYEVAPLTWEELPTNAVYLFSIEGVPYVVGLSGSDSTNDYDEEHEFSRPGSRDSRLLQIVAKNHETCRLVREMILKQARVVSALRGKTLIVRSGQKPSRPEVEFTTIEPVEQSRIVLPETIFQAVDRTILKQMELADRLRQSGQRTRTAILLYGPPGTGKTLLTRYLVAQSEGFTTILLQGFQRSLVREAFRLARYLEPSLVILEDVDLIAVRRQKNRRGTSALHALLDELDGLAPESRCAVIMTTNRPDVLEPALASRPGRVTQAIEFPMPTVDEREKLFSLFLSEVNFSNIDLNAWAIKTDGASPAFLEELVRRSVLIAIQRQLDSEMTEVTEEDLRTAMHEIISLGGQLTRQLLGHV